VKIESPIEEPEIVLTMDQQLRAMMRDFDSFKTTYSGGKSWAWLKLLANPTREEVDDYGKATATFLREQLFSLGGATTAFLGRLLLGLVVMVISMYFFFLDGPKMIDALRGLSPLDDDHERELIEEFDRVSRAVVLATLLSALAQGLLAGIGFAVVGVDNVFLLTMLTVCMSLVPFFGAASVWFPVCVWLYFVELRIGAAIGLGIFGFAVVSTVDNLIKPYVLHGQSNIHPLIALLSVLGGVSAMGPMGILVGPMIVVFLQTVLKILQREMTKMDRSGMSRAALAGANVPLNLEGEELATDRNDSAEQGGHAGLEPSADNSQKGLSSASHPTHPPSSSNKPSGEKRPKRKRR
jgi:predicted PurR-regulated permease PerM